MLLFSSSKSWLHFTFLALSVIKSAGGYCLADPPFTSPDEPPALIKRSIKNPRFLN
ncbi:hypothetical protein OIU78_019799 [Salix suchowensis]|nr:hypothetical protein OIU78_019799 [Salix suchowensis]